MQGHDRRGHEVLPRGRKARAMLAILILDGPGPVLRERLCQLLWSRRHRDQARASLRQSIHELQESLAPIGPDLLRVDRGGLCLQHDAFAVDLDVFAPSAPLGWPAPRGDDAPPLARARLLEDLVGIDPAFEIWVNEQRRRISRQMVLRAEAVLGHPDHAAFAAGTREAAAGFLVDLYPGHELAGQVVIAEHIARGGAADYKSVGGAADYISVGGAADYKNSGGTTGHNALGETVESPTASEAAISYRGNRLGGRRHNGERTVRLGVLPFRALDRGAEDGLAAGMADEITAALSRFRWFFLVASPSLAALANETREGSERWRALDLDFLVEGSVRRTDDRVRVSARLLDLRAGGEVVWADRFDRVGNDVMTLQDEIASAMVAQIDPQLLLHEARRAKAAPATSLSAYEMVLGTIPTLYQLEETSFVAAGATLGAAAERDPNYAGAYTWWAFWHVFMVGQGWAAHHAAGLERAGALAERAMALDPYDARALAIAGHALDMQHLPTNQSANLHERALALNANLPIAWGFAGLSHSLNGNQREAIRMIGQARALSPFDPQGFYFEMLAMVPQMLLGEFAIAAELGRRAIMLNPSLSSSYKGLLVALGHLGQKDEARQVCRRLLALEPGYNLRDADARSAIRQADERALFLEGLRLGGLPA